MEGPARMARAGARWSGAACARAQVGAGPAGSSCANARRARRGAGGAGRLRQRVALERRRRLAGALRGARARGAGRTCRLASRRAGQTGMRPSLAGEGGEAEYLAAQFGARLSCAPESFAYFSVAAGKRGRGHRINVQLVSYSCFARPSYGGDEGTSSLPKEPLDGFGASGHSKGQRARRPSAFGPRPSAIKIIASLHPNCRPVRAVRAARESKTSWQPIVRAPGRPPASPRLDLARQARQGRAGK